MTPATVLIKSLRKGVCRGMSGTQGMHKQALRMPVTAAFEELLKVL